MEKAQNIIRPATFGGVEQKSRGCREHHQQKGGSGSRLGVKRSCVIHLCQAHPGGKWPQKTPFIEVFAYAKRVSMFQVAMGG